MQSVELGPEQASHVSWHAPHALSPMAYVWAGQVTRHSPPTSFGAAGAQLVQLELVRPLHARQLASQEAQRPSSTKSDAPHSATQLPSSCSAAAELF